MKAGAKAAGKKNSFPTKDSFWCAPESDPVGLEQPTLIDPTRTNPSAHIEWTVDDEIPVAIPKRDSAANPSPEGTCSIDIYALNRVGLAQARHTLLVDLRARAEAILEAIDISESPGYSEPARSKQIAHAQKLVRAMESFAQENRPYSAMALTFIESFKARLSSQIR